MEDRMGLNNSFEKLYEDQLKFVKEIYSSTKEESQDVLKKADDVLNRVGKTEEDLRSIVKKGTTLILGLLVFFGSFFGFLGIKTWIDITKRYHEFKGFSIESKEMYTELSESKKQADKILTDLYLLSEKSNVLKEITLEIRRLVEDSRVTDDIDGLSLSEISDASSRFRETVRDIWKYIEKAEDIHYLVLFEAINKYCLLAKLGDIKLASNKIAALIKSSIIVLKNCDKNDWRTQLRCSNLICCKTKSLYEQNSDLYNDQIENIRLKIIGADNESKYKWNLVIILSKLGIMDPEHMEYLISYLKRINNSNSRVNEPGRTWLSCSAAIELLKNRKVDGWNVFSNYFKKGTPRQKSIAIRSLSNLGRKKLENLDIYNNLKISDNVDTFDFFIDHLKTLKQNAKDKYSIRYYDKMVRNLNI